MGISCSLKHAVFFTLRFSEQVVSADKYPCIFSRLVEVILTGNTCWSCERLYFKLPLKLFTATNAFYSNALFMVVVAIFQTTLAFDNNTAKTLFSLIYLYKANSPNSNSDIFIIFVYCYLCCFSFHYHLHLR